MANDLEGKLLRYLRHEARDNGTEFYFDGVLWKSGIVAHEKTRAGQQASELWPFGFEETKLAMEQLAQRGKISFIESETGKATGVKLEEKIKNVKRFRITINVNASVISIIALIIAVVALIVALT